MSNETDHAQVATAGDNSMLPLFVDLDGSLTSTDLLWESLFALLKRHPGLIFLIPLWAFRGKSALKDRVSREINLPSESLPYEPAVLELIHERREAGGAVFLATASPETWSRPIAEYLGVFEGVLATRPDLNLKGLRKLEAISQLWRSAAGLALITWAIPMPIYPSGGQRRRPTSLARMGCSPGESADSDRPWRSTTLASPAALSRPPSRRCGRTSGPRTR